MDNPRAEDVASLLREHLDEMASISQPESKHALGIDALCSPDITFWTAREGEILLGCGALLEIDQRHGEIKSMRTAKDHLRTGVAAKILGHIIAEAERRSYTRLSLETGFQDDFAPARAMYLRFGFTFCGPFAGYQPDPDSMFMMRTL